MKTVALRFGEMFSPDCGTIRAHQEIIDRLGYVWYGKMGAMVSSRVIEEMEKQKSPRILLIRSGHPERYWAYISGTKNEMPEMSAIPEYYRDRADSFKTWFKIYKIEKTQKDIMSKCKVISSGKSLSEASRKSMSPYFIIEYEEEET